MHVFTYVHLSQVKDQQEAEKKKVTSEEIQGQLKIQTKDIKQKREMVLGDLAKVEPAVKEAQNGGPFIEISLCKYWCTARVHVYMCVHNIM